jgi:glycosyltransferase involved in cell wall biosynthesis
MNPAITVIIPVFNGALFVADAIASVLDQHDSRCAVVVVDDGSTDDTPQILTRFGDQIAVVTQPNRGLAAARNCGIRAATTDLLIFLDSDDLLPAGYIDALLATAHAAPSVDVFHSGWRGTEFESGRALFSKETPLPLDGDPFHVLLAIGSPHIDSLCIRRRVVDRVGVFDESLTLQEDWDYWLRLAVGGARFQGVSAPPAIIRYRVNSMSMKVGKELALTGLAVAERAFAAHLPCPLCPNSHRLDAWRRLAVRRSAYDIAARLLVHGRMGHWIGMASVLMQRPRLIPAMYRELQGRRRQRSSSK